jgi:uncharacterized protein YabN with tetrapyrrole methylase and pyrophosphatase domain
MAINQSSISVTVKTRPSTVVATTDRRAAATTNTQPITLKTQARTANFIEDMLDVIEASPQDGFTLVYNSSLDKYEVKQLSSTEINITGLDGGTF